MKKILYLLAIITFLLSNSAFAQERYYYERWIQGQVKAVSKNSISVGGINYQLDPSIPITDLHENILDVNALRNAEVVKILERNGRAAKIIIILLRM